MYVCAYVCAYVCGYVCVFKYMWQKYSLTSQQHAFGGKQLDALD